MKNWGAVIVVVVSLSAAIAAAQAPPPGKTPRVHTSACSLADSMASRFALKNVSPEQAESMCKQLAPVMSAEDLAEFMRCCTTRLRTGKAAGPAAVSPTPQAL
jgi:hypothetical protein